MYHTTSNIQATLYMNILCGVPQGYIYNILGPLPCILCINYIVKVSTVLNPALFADVTSQCHAHTHFDSLIEEVNEELPKLTTSLHTIKLALNKI